MPSRETVVVAMSGGVDSSIAAALLLDQGYDVIGVTMQIWQESATETRGAGCCSLGAVEDARRVAAKLGIPHYCLNYREYFADKVIGDFSREYARGRTPNPCVNCNRYVKFDALLKRGQELGARYLATGHYARIERSETRGRWMLRRARASAKDQTYALYHFTQSQLASTLMPLGELESKDETRAIAQRIGLSVANKPDSQEICFVQGGSYTDFLSKNVPQTVKAGNIVDTSGKIRGTHDGVAFYTIGQRKRINVGSPVPLFVVQLDPETQTVVVGGEDDLRADGLLALDCNWISESDAHAAATNDAGTLSAKIRYNMQSAPARLRPVSGVSDGIEVLFETPQRAVTPGQSVVIYDGDSVVGGGTIERRIDLRLREVQQSNGGQNV